MELRHLRYFLALADTLHFGRAARALHVSQPTLSQQIQKLEEELGSPLLERAPRVRLTQAGELFRTYASRAVEDVLAGEQAVSALRGLATGALRIGYLPSLRGLVVPALSAVLRRHPGLRVRTEEGVGGRIERRVAEGRLDVGIAYATARSAELDHEPLFESRLGLVVGPRHALAGEPRVSLARLADESFALLSRGLRARATIDAYFATARFSPSVVLEANAVAAVLDVVRLGLAVTLLPEPRVTLAERLPVVALSPAPPSQLTTLVWRRAAPRGAAVAAFVDELRSRVR
ncbi:MAG TPA: LysR substrate-binding domain-containing protein [Gaiellaceae bacterium]|nr:LysR substrate-binding domain-containing protein [Gaiellaceae bacterium]